MEITIFMFLIGIVVIILGWLLDLGGLFLAIKAKERNNSSIGKKCYKVMTIGEKITNIGAGMVYLTPLYVIIDVFKIVI